MRNGQGSFRGGRNLRECCEARRKLERSEMSDAEAPSFLHLRAIPAIRPRPWQQPRGKPHAPRGVGTAVGKPLWQFMCGQFGNSADEDFRIVDRFFNVSVGSGGDEQALAVALHGMSGGQKDG